MKQKKNKKKISTSRRLLNISLLAIFNILLIFLLVNFGIAWIFVSKLIQPECQEPQHLSVNYHPVEYWIKTSDDLSLRIWYYASQNGAVILSFGGLNGSLGNQIPQIDFLIESGYGVIQVDSRACAVPKANVTLGVFELLDAEAALAYAMNNVDAIHGRIGTIGFSMGGATAIRLAARHPEIRAVVRDGGYKNMAKLLTPGIDASILQKFFQFILYSIFQFRTGIDPKTINLLNDLLKISPRPVLLIYGENEANPGITQYQVLEEPKELWIVPGSTHGRNHLEYPVEYKNRILNFFNHALLE